MDRLRLLLAFDERMYPDGSDVLIRSDAERLKPPVWAGGTLLVDSLEDYPDCVLFILSGNPSSGIRNIFFNAFRRGISCAALCCGELAGREPVAAKLNSWKRLWTFDSSTSARQVLFSHVQEWISSLARESFPFPSGEELLAEWSETDPGTVDNDILELAEEKLDTRGFVCLSGSLGAGKTTLARHLLMKYAREGMNPIEHISPDLDNVLIETILKGAEDCILLFDLDTMRRTIELYPIDLWLLALSQLIRATDARRRLVLASSSPRIAAVFDLLSDVHILLPKPATARRWRLDQGRQALSWFRAMDDISKAEPILLAMFEPVVSESLYRKILFSFWRRLFIMIHSRFPSDEELEKRYSAGLAAAGKKPFRRINLRGEIHIAAGDTMMMSSIDQGIKELLQKNSPLIRILGDTLLFNDDPVVRRAGYTLFFFYGLIPPEDKANLLFAISGEEEYSNLFDQFSVLLGKQKIFDQSAMSLCRYITASGSLSARRAVAACLGKPWIRKNPDMTNLLEDAISDRDPSVRQQLMWSLGIWHVQDESCRFYTELMKDESPIVRGQLLRHLGSRFPHVTEEEMKILNSELERGNSDMLVKLAAGLLNRRPEEFVDEFNDLLWLLMDRLPHGGKGILANNIGGRLRFFAPEIRTSLISDILPEDEYSVAQCLMMNYKWLSWSELEILWTMIMRRTPSDLDFASLVLRNLQVLDDEERRLLIKTVLTFEPFDGREALSQLLASGRTDLADLSLDVITGVIETGSVDRKARLSWFLLWNRESFGERGAKLLAELSKESSPAVRTSVASSIRRLGYSDIDSMEILLELSSDSQRSVRASAGEAIGELAGDWMEEHRFQGRLKDLLEDDDSFVRVRTLAGFTRATGMLMEQKAESVIIALKDPEITVRRGALISLDLNRDICTAAGVDSALGDLLVDSNEEVRLEAIRLVTSCPELISSENLRKRLPDLFLDRLAGGGAIAEELITARKIQFDLLPDHPPILEAYDIEVFYRPAREVGGDYYDFFSLPDSNIGITVADVMGKGIPAALTMAGLKGNLGAFIRSIYSISEIIVKVNESIVTTGAESSTLIGLFYGVINVASGELTYVNAGHNPPLLFRREGGVKQLDKGGLLLGFMPDAGYEFGVEMIRTGDVLVLYTDGITEIMDESGREFGEDGLRDVVDKSRDLSARQIVTGILSAIGDFGTGAPQADDQTLVVLKNR